VSAELDELLARVWGIPSLRQEDRKKVEELRGLLPEIERVGKRALVVDAAAGHAYAGLVAAERLGIERLHVIEREPARAERCRQAAARLTRPVELTVATGDVADRALWPAAPDLVIALHACGTASDAILDASVAAGTRWLLLVPCCYAHAVPFSATAERHAATLGVTHGEVRRRLIESLVDAERTLRLEAAGYDVTVVPFVAPTVTPHNLLWRARRAGEPRRMEAAAEKLRSLRAIG
jgi:hypothetical protein